MLIVGKISAVPFYYGSFQNKGFWMKSGSVFPDGEMPYDTSFRIEPKRHHQWFLDASDTELLPSKKSAVEGSDNRPISGVPNVNVSWESPSSFQSLPGHFTDRLFGEPPRTIDFGGRNFQSVNAGNMDIGRRGIEDHYENDASIALSMSHTMQDPGPCLSYGGIRKVRVNQVKDNDNGMSMQIPYSRGECNTISFSGFQEAREKNPPSCRPNQVNDSGNGMSVQMFNRFDSNTISFSGYQDEHEASVHSVKDSDSIMSMQLSNTFNKGDSSTISFSGFPVEPGMSNYDLLVRQSSLQQSEVLKEKEVSDTTTDLVASATPVATASAPKAKSEPKVSKKVPPNNFPSNVRSLLNTGMLDGVPVKYISWQHEELGGVIKGSGYLCGCKSCNYSQALNAYEFEKHAGTKTKHPNNHIYFENGKTIYAIVQELKSTPHNMLFDAIQNCTGSQINQKAFKTWKESFQAATRELERIYGKDLLKLASNDN
ncbi:hypothetical protein IFM89_013676 [Coptis chinensis]|uniref:Tify domain-containing protein n=1 Tax=Coptis chinensis TaxID=261450 RepID=A0A835M642_9MAGN|nr:hypothetical protein IFM89_013676 [Coptis chinensis]